VSNDVLLKSNSPLEVAQRKNQVFEYHKQGLTQSTIADILGISTGTVGRYLKAELEVLAEQNVTLMESARDVELSRLDDLQASLWKDALGGKLATVDRVIRIIERRCKLLGLDKPTQVEHAIGDAFAELVAKANEGRVIQSETEAIEARTAAATESETET